MRLTKFTYPLIALAIIPVALISLKKINKNSFFDHFFKVIEEVELRNSHELESYSNHIWYKASLVQKKDLKKLILKYSSNTPLFVSLFIPQKFQTPFIQESRKIGIGMILGYLIPLTRAP
ncbi:MAG: hypothetical protein MRZ79_09650 [Bacteroidia bacterium]|nr:hypothetical protein [Bacteroidia bacterium]